MGIWTGPRLDGGNLGHHDRAGDNLNPPPAYRTASRMDDPQLCHYSRIHNLPDTRYRIGYLESRDDSRAQSSCKLVGVGHSAIDCRVRSARSKDLLKISGGTCNGGSTNNGSG